ncbi:MAG: hypothetical protein V7K92_17340 [Nostoc sp.]|uniref:hypothetical protein n=1 Tax=Nostoc sp. TaxID=1180 RepID=UPI002FEE8796
MLTGARIHEACTLLKGDVVSQKGVRPKLIIRSVDMVLQRSRDMHYPSSVTLRKLLPFLKSRAFV